MVSVVQGYTLSGEYCAGNFSDVGPWRTDVPGLYLNLLLCFTRSVKTRILETFDCPSLHIVKNLMFRFHYSLCPFSFATLKSSPFIISNTKMMTGKVIKTVLSFQ